MNKSLRYTLVIGLLWIVGCTPISKFVPKYDVPNSILKMYGAPEAFSNGVPALGANTGYTLLADSTACKKSAILANRLKSGDVENITFVAGSAVVIQYHYAQFLPLFACIGAYEFSPEVGQTYLLRWNQNPFLNGRCLPRLQQLKGFGGQVIDVPVKAVCVGSD